MMSSEPVDREYACWKIASRAVNATPCGFLSSRRLFPNVAHWHRFERPRFELGLARQWRAIGLSGEGMALTTPTQTGLHVGPAISDRGTLGSFSNLDP